MGAAINRDAFSGEAIRRYELGLDRPGADALSALAKIFDKTEAYIEYGSNHVRKGTGEDEKESEPETNEEKLVAVVRAWLETDRLGRDAIWAGTQRAQQRARRRTKTNRTAASIKR